MSVNEGAAPSRSGARRRPLMIKKRKQMSKVIHHERSVRIQDLDVDKEAGGADRADGDAGVDICWFTINS